MPQRVVNAAQTANRTNTAQTANKTTAAQTTSKTNTAQTANKSNATQTAAKTGQTTTTSPYGGMNYDTYLKSQGKDTGYTPTVTKYAPDGTAYQSSAPTYTGSTQKYAPDGTAYTVSSGGTTASTIASKSATPSLDMLVGDPRDLPSGQAINPYHVGPKDTGADPDGFPTDGGGGGGGGSSGGRAGVGGYTAAVLPSATSQADYINALYNANEQKHKAALETAYDANVATLDRQAATIAPQYQQAANAAAAQSAVAQAAFNERAAAAGMNTGVGSQAALAQNNALQSNISSIRQAESEALAEVEAQRASLAQQYQKAIAEAVANNDAARAQALYAEAVRVDESLVSTAANQAAENFNAWKAMYKLAKG